LSTRPCQHRCEQLAATATCGARCPWFPACLPPPRPELAARVVAWRTDQDRARADALALDDALGRLHAAITEGLDRKEQAWEP
jgi:hypothetical protein